ncbi:hypothetical protein [Paenibacillus albidus]|uniref:hypothetical protein n=1 Tax=Paenibacillus albidus TaxID=2041023 RepID=UPI00166E9DA2|nr:hypothetical protein [Paenibacillus albidus]
MNPRKIQYKAVLWKTVPLLVLGGLILTGCNTQPSATPDPVNAAASEFSDREMTGYVLSLNSQRRVISLNISDWINRHNQTGTREDMMHSVEVTLDHEVLLEDEEGLPIQPGDLRIGDKLKVSSVPQVQKQSGERLAVTADRLTRLHISRTEKLKWLLARSNGSIHTVVLYDEGTVPQVDELDFGREVPGAFTGGISWVEHRPGEAVDYKQGLGISQLPMLLVFDREGLIYQTASIKELQQWFNDRAAASKPANSSSLK